MSAIECASVIECCFPFCQRGGIVGREKGRFRLLVQTLNHFRRHFGRLRGWRQSWFSRLVQTLNLFGRLLGRLRARQQSWFSFLVQTLNLIGRLLDKAGLACSCKRSTSSDDTSAVFAACDKITSAGRRKSSYHPLSTRQDGIGISVLRHLEFVVVALATRR